MATVVDAKSLYDNLNQEQYTGAERRAALEICVIRDSLRSLGGKCRWVPHELNPADGLTKLKGNVSTLMQLMRTAKYRLVDEKGELERRAQYREATGRQKNPRPNRMYVSWADQQKRKGAEKDRAGSLCSRAKINVTSQRKVEEQRLLSDVKDEDYIWERPEDGVEDVMDK